MIMELMNGERDAAKVSRRQVFQGTVMTAGGIAILFGMAPTAEAKMTFQGSGYQPTPKGDQNCAGCSLFQSPSSCILVDGNISPNGWCRFYRKKT